MLPDLQISSGTFFAYFAQDSRSEVVSVLVVIDEREKVVNKTVAYGSMLHLCISQWENRVQCNIIQGIDFTGAWPYM